MYKRILQDAYFILANEFNIPVALDDLNKELKKMDKSYLVTNLINELLDDFDIKFRIELLMFPSWATKKKMYQINGEYYTHIRIKRNLIR